MMTHGMEIAKGVYNVGVADWNIRDFHGYSTKEGSTYNSYLIVDEKIVLIDTVKESFSGKLLENISKIVDPKNIDVFVSNHTEMDHSGGIPRIMHRIGEDKPFYCSKMGLKNLSLHFPQSYNYHPVKTGDELDLGKRTLSFLETRMIHWPDSMFSYLKEDKILFSSDGFGQHYAGPERFDDEIGDDIMPHAKKYFANILLLYAPRIAKLIDQVVEMGLEIDMICPDHGIIWRKDPARIINAYVQWCKQTPVAKAIVVFDTMWHSSESMAEAIVEGIAGEGVKAKPMCLKSCHRSDVITEVLDAAAVVAGSPTLNNGLFPTVADFLAYMKGLKPQNKIGAAFGSYGWSGEASGLIQSALNSMKFDMPEDPLKIHYVPDEKDLEACREFGAKIGRAVKQAVGV
jgi:flavorubredoxin